MDKKRILSGVDYREEIADGIGSADVFISLLSPDSVTSKWVKREIYYADDKEKCIIPVLVRFVKFPQDGDTWASELPHHYQNLVRVMTAGMVMRP